MSAVSAYAREGGIFSFRFIIHIIAPAPCLAQAASRGIADEMQYFLDILVIRIAFFRFFNPIIEHTGLTEDQAKGSAQRMDFRARTATPLEPDEMEPD